MKLVDIDARTEGTFFRCLHDEKPQDPRVTDLRRRWYNRFKAKGLRAKVLVREDDAVVGLCQYLPIEHSQFLGEGLLAILCIWVHGYAHLVGNQQGKGYGRFILERIEEDARASGVKGIAAWGMDFPHWNPVSFYEHMGYVRVEKDGPVVLVWKRFAEDARPPAILRQKRGLPKGGDRPEVRAFNMGWGGVGCEWCVMARDAVKGLEDRVTYEEIDTSDRTTRLGWGIDQGVYVDGEFFEEPLFWKSEDLRKEILRAARTAGRGKDADARGRADDRTF